jgi:hypothetical protein
MHLIGRHDPDNTGTVGDLCSRKCAGSFTRKDIVDLYLPGMHMVSYGTAGIDPYMMKTHMSPGIFSHHQVPEKDSGKLRVRVPWEGFNSEFLPGPDDRGVPAG